MECRTTCPVKRRRGFTYVEFLVASSITILVAAGIMYFMLFSGRSLLTMSSHFALDSQARQAVDRMTQEIRQAMAVTGYSTNAINLSMASGGNVTFSYDSSKRQVSRTQGGQTTVLLKECDSFTFKMFSRVPVSGSFSLDEVALPAQCKAVEVSWNCSRSFVGPAIQTKNATLVMIALRMK